MDTNEREFIISDSVEDSSVTEQAERLSRWLYLDARRYDRLGGRTQ